MASWSDRVSQMTQNAISKSKEVAGVAKLNMEISSLNQEIKNIQLQAGAYVLDNGFLLANPYIADWAEKVESLKAEIEEKNERIMELKNVVICTGCGREVSRSNRFCEHCGTEIAIKVPSSVVTDTDEGKASGEEIIVESSQETPEPRADEAKAPTECGCGESTESPESPQTPAAEETV